MNLTPELKKLAQLKLEDRKIPITLTTAPEALRMLDKECENMRMSRGDMLFACFLRVAGSYEGKKTYLDMAEEGRARFEEQCAAADRANGD